MEGNGLNPAKFNGSNYALSMISLKNKIFVVLSINLMREKSCLRISLWYPIVDSFLIHKIMLSRKLT